MDTRETLPVKGSFYEQVKAIYEQKQGISILYEDGGVTRANGLVTSLFEREGIMWMRLNDKVDIRIDKLYAVNGTFASDYSEC